MRKIEKQPHCVVQLKSGETVAYKGKGTLPRGASLITLNTGDIVDPRYLIKSNGSTRTAVHAHGEEATLFLNGVPCRLIPLP